MALHFTDENFKSEVLSSQVPVLVDFYADWCAPCKRMAPVVDNLSAAYEGKAKIGKINIEENPKAVETYNVMSIPTFIVFKDGQPANAVVGEVKKEKLEDMLQ